MTKCKQCGGQIVWTQTEGRWYGRNPDGSDHWDACSKRRWEQVKATGERFEAAEASGYARSVHGTKYDRINAKPIRGENYQPTGLCRQCVPPWEICAGCPDQWAA